MPHAAPDDVFSSLTSRQRLADISHHFLSDKGEQSAPWQKTCLIPLLLVCREDDFVVYLLKTALQQHHRNCVVLNIENQPDPLSISKSMAGEKDGAPDICLLPLTSPGSTLAIPHNKLLMAVPTSLPGIRLAYHHLAQLAEQGSRLTVSIIMLDARSEKHGERYFSFLSDSAKSLLSLEVKSAGVLYRRQTSSDETYGGTDKIIRNILMDEGKHASPAFSPKPNASTGNTQHLRLMPAATPAE